MKGYEFCINWNDLKEQAQQRICLAMSRTTKEPPFESITIGASEEQRDAIAETYLKGINDAWEAARIVDHMDENKRLIVFGDQYAHNVFNDWSADEAIRAIHAFEPEPKSIEQGDIVRHKGKPGIELYVTYTCKEDGIFNGIALTEYEDFCEVGDSYTEVQMSTYEKTGEHYDLVEVLTRMRK